MSLVENQIIVPKRWKQLGSLLRHFDYVYPKLERTKATQIMIIIVV